MAHYYFGNHPHACAKNGAKIHTRSHYDYICREGQYSNMQGKKEDLVFSCSGNLPDWANTAGQFWDAAKKVVNPTVERIERSVWDFKKNSAWKKILPSSKNF